MPEKNIPSRVVNKHDTQANWEKAINFTPKAGELIIYDIDENYTCPRFKVGDGANNVNDLIFTDERLISQLETKADADYVEALYQKLNSDMTLRFYCVEDVEIITNGVSKTYPANSNVEVKFIETDTYEIIPTSDNSILALNGFPGALGIYYSWLEGVKQFSNILFDMNNEDFYSKWS